MVFQDLDDFLSNGDILGATEPVDMPIPLSDFNGVDPRLLDTSYSSTQDFASCPRKFQLRKLNSVVTKSSRNDYMKTLTFQFGHTIGQLVQDSLHGVLSRERIIFNAFVNWEISLNEENPRQQKSFYHALEAIERFWELQDAGFWDEYEVATLKDGRPAIELSFKIVYPNGTIYRGFVDAILRNKVTGEFVILELKSSSGTWVSQDNYVNSEQGIGYSVILDQIVDGNIDFTVQYLVYMTRLRKWEPMQFQKTYTQRALWVRDRLWDAEVIENLIQKEGSHGIWPTRSQGCNTFGSTCQFMGLCQLDTAQLIKPLTQRTANSYGEEEVDFTFKIEELV